MIENAALLIIDMQMMMQERIDSGRQHVNPDFARNVAALLASFRMTGRTVVHVRHRDSDPASPLHIAAAGHLPIPAAREETGEPLFFKSGSSAFSTPELADFLRASSISHIYVVGAVAGFCVNSTVRAASDLGFKMCVVRDAVLGFDLPDAGLDARTIFDVTMALLEADFATITDTGTLLAQL